MTQKIYRSGGIDLQANQIDIIGDVVGRDKIVQNISRIINNITQRPLTAAEEADRAQSIEIKRLRQGVTDYIERLRARVNAATETGGPYRGLLEFRLSDAAVFFGRNQAIGDLLEHLQRSPLTILHAESGAGKTSLLQAGVSPRLIAKGHLPIYLRPYNINPAIAIKRAFIADLHETPNLAQAPLRDYLSRVCDVLGAQTTLYLFIDQFEEFFTRLEEAKRDEFINELAACLEDESLNVRWVLALRAESFSNLANFQPRIRNPFENQYRLNRLTQAEAHEAIAKPAAQRGISFADGLIDQMLNDLGKEEVAPPQVQLVCSALYETLPDNTKVITRQLYDQEHGAKGILQEHLGRVLHRDLPADQRPIAQHVLEALITSGLHRRLRSREELAVELTLRDTKPETLDRVLNQLVDSRLLRVEEINGVLSYELAHDYLLTEIQLDPAVQARKAAQELLEQEVHAYQRYGTLLSDDKFAILSPRRDELALNNDAQSLLQKSERALKRRQRLVFGGIGLVIVLVIIGVISIVTAIGAQTVAQDARQQQATAELNATQAAQSAADARTSAAMAATRETAANQSAATAQALRITSEAAANAAQFMQATAEARAAFAATREAVAYTTLQRSFEETGIVPVGKAPIAFAFDGTRLWVANSGDNTVQSIDPTTGKVDTSIAVGTLPVALAFDGTRLWVANNGDNTVESIDPATGQVGAPIKVGNLPVALAFDGTRLWVANRGDHTVQPIDPTIGQLGTPISVGRTYTALAFDGTQLWVVNSFDNAVQPIDPTTGKVGPPIPVGRFPTALAFDGTRLWVANSDNTVQPIDPMTGQSVSAAILTGLGPMALISISDHLWIANRRDNTIQAVVLTAGDVSRPVPVGASPAALAFDGTQLWVANFSSNTVQSIDPTTGKVGPPIPVGRFPTALAFDGTRLWVANQGDHTVQPINPTTRQVSMPIAVGTIPVALAFDGTRLWVANRGDHTVQPINPTTHQVSMPIAVGATPVALAFDGTRLWVANNGDNTVESIDPATGQVGAPIKVGNLPVALAFDGTRLWVANYDDSTVQSIAPTTRQVSMPTKVGQGSTPGPTALIFDALHARLWVANGVDGTVRYIVIHESR